ncbi:MAG: hypothetical protein KDA20_04350 [Phycisphaerales bacterium]|nr:hypothetical protein [Phycisphaerales bacterium]
MRSLIAIVASLVLALPLVAQNVVAHSEEPVRNPEQYNLPKQSTLAIEGYDPVAYFPEGGGKPTKGANSIALDYMGVTYRFVSDAHRELFKKNPKRYEPAFGGWCAYAMADGDKVEVDPKSFLIEDNRLLLFYDGFLADTRAKWTKSLKKNKPLAPDADQHWLTISGESPRHVEQVAE